MKCVVAFDKNDVYYPNIKMAIQAMCYYGNDGDMFAVYKADKNGRRAEFHRCYTVCKKV